MGADYRLHLSSNLATRTREVADAFGDAIEATGRSVERATDVVAAPTPGVVDLVVAPGERYAGSPGSAELVRFASWAVSFGTALPGDPAFEVEARFASFGPAALSIHQSATWRLRQRQVDAERLLWGYHPPWDGWAGADGDRPTDVAFLGSLTEHRDRSLAEGAWALSGLSCDIRLFDGTDLHPEALPHLVFGDERRAFLRAARALLWLPRWAGGPLDWVAAVEAISNGCVVVTDALDELAPLLGGRHLLATTGAQLPARLLGLLADEDRRRTMAAAGYELLRKEVTLVDSVDRSLRWLEQRTAHRLVAPYAPTRYRPDGSVCASQQAEGRHAAPGPRHESSRFALIKRLALSELESIRSIEAARSLIVHGDAEYADIEQTPSWADARPEVSVLITAFNHEEFVRGAIDSAVANDGVDLEIVVVDDHSGDGTVTSVRQAIAGLPDVPIRLVAAAANRGVSAARNRAFDHARADRLLVLDADDLLRPKALRLLLDAVADGPDMAYGLIDRFGTTTGLISCLPWSVGRLCRDNYIAVTALWTRRAWERIGGFDPDIDRVGGFEDWDALLRFASRGLRAVLVTDFVGRYRSQASSHLSMGNLDVGSMRTLLRSRYPELPWPIQT